MIPSWYPHMHLVSRTKVSSCLVPLRAVAAFSSGSVQGHKGRKKTLVSQWSRKAPPAASSLLDRTFNSKTAKSYVTFPDCWIVLILWAEEATNNLKGTATSHTSSKELDEINFDINSAWEKLPLCRRQFLLVTYSFMIIPVSKISISYINKLYHLFCLSIFKNIKNSH